MRYRIGTRGSALALAQAELVRTKLTECFPEHKFELAVIKTNGDRLSHLPVKEIGTKGVFIREIEEYLLADRIDLAVHSMKDMPVMLPKGLTLAKTWKREDPRDALILRERKDLSVLPEHAVIAASNDEEQNRQISALCNNRNIPVNVVDQPELCTFLFPALVKRGELSIGISTSGASPSAAVWLKQEIEGMLPERMGEMMGGIKRWPALLLCFVMILCMACGNSTGASQTESSAEPSDDAENGATPQLPEGEEASGTGAGTEESEAHAGITTNAGIEIKFEDLEHYAADGSAVYYTKDITPEALVNIYKALGWEAEGKTGVKISTGEPPASHYLEPSLMKDLVQMVDGAIVECNTAYGGSRANTAMHYQVAEDHGFTAIADVDILDAGEAIGLGSRSYRLAGIDD